MPRRRAKVTQAEITRAIRAAKEAVAAEVIIDSEGQIRIVVTSAAPAVSASPASEEGYVWTRSVPAKRSRGHRETLLLGGIFQNANPGPILERVQSALVFTG